MARKVYVDLKVRLIIDLNETIDVSEVIQEMDYGFTTSGSSVEDVATIQDTEILNFEIIDSK